MEKRIEERERDWHESRDTHRIHRYKCQTTRRKGGEAVSRPRRKVQSTDAQRCIGNAPIRGLRSGPICSVHERGGREGGRENERDAGIPWHGAPCPSLVAITEHSSREKRPLLSLSLSLSSIVIDGLSCPLYGVFKKKKKKKSKDRLVSPLDREKETTPLIIVNPHSGQINRNANLFFQLFFQFNQSGVEKGDRDDYLSLLWWTRDEDV